MRTVHRPEWSVIVPSYDRPEELRRCLSALQQLRAPRSGARTADPVAVDAVDARVEIVVVDDGGALPAAAVAAGVRGPHPVRVHRQPNRGPAAARNAGAEQARGRRLAFTDDDCRPRPDWLVGLAAGLDRHPEALVGGRTINALSGNPWSEATQAMVDHVVARTPGGFLPSCNLAVDREAFRAAGGFDQTFPRAAGEDRALCDTWRRTGRPVLLLPGALVDHEHRLSARSFWRQHVGYGRAARVVHRSAGGSRPGRVADYLALVLGPFRRHRPRQAAGLSLRLAVSQLATAWGWLQAGRTAVRPKAQGRR